jgi:hypothetical protein
MWKWILASLVIPLVTIISSLVGVGTSFKTFILAFWPSSLFLASLDTRENPISDVIYVWSIAVSVNIALYALIGAVIYVLLTSNRVKQKK